MAHFKILSLLLSLIGSLSLSLALFVLKCEIICSWVFLPLAAPPSCLCLRKHQHFVYTECWKKRIKFDEGTFNEFVVFVRSHKLSFLLAAAENFKMKKIQATCTTFSPGVVVVVFKSCAQRELAWNKTKRKFYIYKLNIYIYKYIIFSIISNRSNASVNISHFYISTLIQLKIEIEFKKMGQG